jgi:hypothetical protein
MIKIKHVSLFLLLSVCLSGVQAQNEALIKRIHDRLISYFEHHAMERTCLITDKEVYKPGENVLFNALAGSMTVQGLYPAGSDLKLSLYRADGKAVAGENYTFSSGMASGSLKIPADLAAGKYVLEAHASSVVHEDEAFMKLIFIDPMNEDEMVFQPQKVPELIIAGESLPVVLAVHDLSGKAISDQKLNYELLSGKEVLASGKLKTDDKGLLSFELDVPKGDYDSPVLLKVSDSKNVNYSRWFHVNTEKLKVSFYAEGGRFTAGIPVKTGFRVTTADGQPVDIVAEITGVEDRMVSQAKTLIPGYGMFPVIVKAAENCYFRIVSELGKGQVFELPAFEQDGFALSVPRTDSEFIHANLVFPDAQLREVNLLLTRGDKLLWASTVKINGSGRMKIPEEGVPTGLCLLSAFDDQGKLLGERLLYIDQPDELQLSVGAEQKQAGEDRSWDLLIKAIPAAKDDSVMVSVSVSAAVKNLEACDDFITCFSLNSLLENKITGIPALKKEGVLNENIIDYLLICNRFRNYSWQSVLDFETAGKTSSAGKAWLSGKVVDRRDEPVQNAKVSMVNTGSAQMMNVTTGEDGHFVFPGIHAAKTDDYVLKAIAPDGNDKLTIRFDKDFNERLSIQVQHFILFNAFNEKPEVPQKFFTNNKFLYVKIKKKAAPAERKDETYLKYLHSGSSILDVIKMIKPYQIVDGDKIVFPGGANSLMAQDGALIVLDGQKMGTSSSMLNTLSPYDIESINISTSPVDISRYTGLNSVGLIEIRTRRGESPEKIKQAENKDDVQEFKGDQRETTLYWSPALSLSNDGEVRVQVPSTQIKGDFQVEVNAIDKEGRLGQSITVLKNR